MNAENTPRRLAARRLAARRLAARRLAARRLAARRLAARRLAARRLAARTSFHSNEKLRCCGIDEDECDVDEELASDLNNTIVHPHPRHKQNTDDQKEGALRLLLHHHHRTLLLLPPPLPPTSAVRHLPPLISDIISRFSTKIVR
ncbi:hypothetical protein L1987_52871 [Smallanthus sonchifolius]|uniref:Uncharacterized protein n=1 Tax=Smallanthus sonchifolius TaxID=185202 RepID=A0ACB9EUS0_9ASTR|nr:hypothetical protein L1987_52871 [Smallanthus sonchifolius]